MTKEAIESTFAATSEALRNLVLQEEEEYEQVHVEKLSEEELADYARFVGKQVNIKLHELHEGQKKIQGVILGVEGNKVKLHLNGKDEIEIEFDNINKARLVYDFRADLRAKKSSK